MRIQQLHRRHLERQEPCHHKGLLHKQDPSKEIFLYPALEIPTSLFSEDPEMEDIDFLTRVTEIVSDYNKVQIENA